MTRIYPVSDLHLEFVKDPIKTLSRCVPQRLDIDVAVIAGDLCCLGKGLYRALEELEGRSYRTIFVPGNHEAYHSGPLCKEKTIMSNDPCEGCAGEDCNTCGYDSPRCPCDYCNHNNCKGCEHNEDC